MTAVLPPIKGAVPPPVKNTNNGAIQTEIQYLPAPPKDSTDKGKLQLDRKIQSKNERKMYQKLQDLRKQLPFLSKRETAMYRHTYKHNLCLDMLQEGFHMSFRELFALIQQQEEDRLRAGPESSIWSQVMLHAEHDKLDKLKIHLTNAETADRRDDYTTVYAERYELAKYFLSTGDKWLSDHFFKTCLSTSHSIVGDGGKAKAEGHRNVGISLKENGDYFQASQHFEAYYELASVNKHWENDEGIVFYTDACKHLYEIYTVIGNKIEQDDPNKSLLLLTKAHDMACNSNDNKLKAESTYKMGLAFDKVGEDEKALMYLLEFLRMCEDTNDHDGIGRACDAIAKAYSRAGKIMECIEYLKQFVETAEHSGQEAEYSKACHNLGNIFNSLGQYEEATEYFSKAYNVSRAMGEPSLIHANRVQYGVAMAHRMLASFGNHIVQGHQPCLERLIEWKSARADEFEKPIPESSTMKVNHQPHTSSHLSTSETSVSTVDSLEGKDKDKSGEEELILEEDEDKKIEMDDSSYTLTTENTEEYTS